MRRTGGDLLNIYAASDGTGRADFFSEGVTLDEGPRNSVFDDDGSAIVVHEKPGHLRGGGVGHGEAGRLRGYTGELGESPPSQPSPVKGEGGRGDGFPVIPAKAESTPPPLTPSPIVGADFKPAPLAHPEPVEGSSALPSPPFPLYPHGFRRNDGWG